MKHRGTARKRLLPVEGDGALSPPGTALRSGGRDIGEIVSVYGSRGFGLVRLDRFAEAAGAAIEADGMNVSIVKPSWLSA